MEENCTSHNFISMLYSKDKSLMLLGFFFILMDRILLVTNINTFFFKQSPTQNLEQNESKR